MPTLTDDTGVHATVARAAVHERAAGFARPVEPSLPLPLQQPTRPIATRRRGLRTSASCVRAMRIGAGTRGVSGARFLTHARLDAHLEILARRPEQFLQDALELCAVLDARGFDLEISDPSVWRGATGSPRVAVDSQFTADVEGLHTMGREEELRLALRIEFARIRFGVALRTHGLDADDPADGSDVSPVVRRRKLEWHALRLEMAERNLHLVLINVARYRHTSADPGDLIQAAAATLFHAVDGFDWRRGVLFRTYAVHWLNQGFREHLYNHNSTIRTPVYLQKCVKHINAAIQRLGDPHASVEEIAHESGLRGTLIARARTATRKTSSLDAPMLDSDETSTLANRLAVQDEDGPYSVALDNVQLASGMTAALGKLSDRERLVVKMRFGIGYGRGHVYSEVAKELGVSLERVRQILLHAMSKMRTPQLRKVLESFAT